MELFFFDCKLPSSRYFTNGLMLLEEGAHKYMVEQIHRNNSTPLAREEYKYYMRERYDKPECRD